MRGKRLCIGAAAGLAVAVQTAAAQPGDEGGRFSMTPTQNGFLRLDKQTGAVSFCTVENGLSVCRVSADERAAFEVEVARLQREVAELKAAQPGAAPSEGSAQRKAEEEFEKGLSFAERFMRRMMRLFRDETSGQKS